MALTVGNANPGSISGVGVANPGRISGVVNATPGRITSVGVAGSQPNISVAPQPASTSSYSSPGSYYAPAPAPVIAPYFDTRAVFANAQAAATGTGNALYNTYLTDFLNQQAALKAQKEAQTATDIKNFQDELKQTQEANALTGTRTTEDVATKEAQIAQTVDQNQQDTGTQFEDQRLAAARAQAGAGTLGSGAGNRETGATTTARNTSEERQAQQFQQQKETQDLFKARTFEDLAKSNTLATTKEAKGEAQSKFDLSSYLENARLQEVSKRNDLNEQRQKAIAQETQYQAKLAYINYVQGISNPAQRTAAVSTYGGLF